MPTGSGFCLYIRARLIEGIGLLDEINFPRGYGGENDFCMRAYYAGFRNIVALDTWIWHAGHSSFGNSRAALELAGLEKLRALYPDYFSLVRKFQTDSTLLQVRAAIGRRIDAASRQARRQGSAGRTGQPGQRPKFPARAAAFIPLSGNMPASTVWRALPENCQECLAAGAFRQFWRQAGQARFHVQGHEPAAPAPQTLQAPPVLDFDIPDKKTIQDLLAGTSGLVCLVDHNWGGGANIYARCRTDAWLRDGQAVLRLAHPPEQPFVYATFHAPRGRLGLQAGKSRPNSRSGLAAFSEIFHQRACALGWPGQWRKMPARPLPRLREKLCALARVRQPLMKMPVHDFFCVCPLFQSGWQEGVYCGLPAESACGECLGNPDFDIGEWRALLFAGFSRIFRRLFVFRRRRDTDPQDLPGSRGKDPPCAPQAACFLAKALCAAAWGPMRVAVINNIQCDQGA